MATQFMDQAGKLRRLISQRGRLLGDTGWVTASFVVQQALRLLTSIILAWLLAPELLGTMVLLNALRTGGELLSDVGVGQSIVRESKAEDPIFYGTAWTVQIIRGSLLFLACLALSVPLAGIYVDESLKVLFPVCAFVFVISGFASPAPYLLQRRRQLSTLSLFGMGTAVASSLIHIGLALYTPTIWALIGGLLLSSVVSVVGSFFLLRGLKYRLKIDRPSLASILKFGKWIFASSIIYFLAMNFDRLYFADAIPFALLGVYGIARTLADSVSLLFLRIGNVIVFPRIATSGVERAQLRASVSRLRHVAVICLALALGFGVAHSDLFIFLAYDERYRAAAIFLPILLIGTWFSTLSAISDAMMMGIGRPSNVAFANSVKLLAIVLIIPQVLPRVGFVAAVVVLASVEALRYSVLSWRKRAHGLSFLRQDLASTVQFFASIVAFRYLSAVVGLTGGFASWVSQLEAVLA